MKNGYPRLLNYILFFIFSLTFTSCLKEEPRVELPTVITAQASKVSGPSAELHGEVTFDGGSQITSRGFVWSINSKPTIDDNKIDNGQGSGKFNSEITGLQSNTKYVIRAFAKNSQGVSYGNEETLQTLEIAVKSDKVVDFALGNSYTLEYNDQMVALLEDGRIYGWTANYEGSLSTPKLFSEKKDWKNVEGFHAINADGSLWVLNFSNYSVEKFYQDKDWKQVSGFMGLKKDGTLWRLNNHGQIQKIGESNNWVELVTGGNIGWHYLIKKSDNTIWAMGFNAFGQLGIGNKINSDKPIQIGSNNHWSNIYAGGYFGNSIGIDKYGFLWEWGYRNKKNIPTKVHIEHKWISVGVGNFYSIGIGEDGSLWHLGEHWDTVDNVQKVGNETNWVRAESAIGEGSEYSLILNDDGSLYTFSSRSNTIVEKINF